MPMGWVAAATVAGSVINSIGAQQAGSQQITGINNASGAIDTNYGNAQNQLSNQYNVATPYITSNYGNAIAGFAPYTALGSSAAGAEKGLIDSGYATHQFNQQDLYNGLSPNYNFQLQQGQQSANQANNAAGGMIGGNAQQALQNYTQNFAQGAYQNAFTNYQNQRNSMFSNLTPLSQLGLDAAKGVGSLYANQGNALAGLATGYGQTSANLYANQGNAQGQLAIGAGNINAATTGAQYDAFGNAVGTAGNIAYLNTIANRGNLGGATATTQTPGANAVLSAPIIGQN